MVLGASNGFPCRLQFANTPVALRTDAAGTVSDFSGFAARGPDGRYYTTAAHDAAVSVWDARGQFVRNFGVEGRGPGEFARGDKAILIDQQSRVYVATNGRWAIFSPALELVRTMSAATTGFNDDYLTFLDDGTLLSAQSVRSGAEDFFRIFDFTREDPGAPAAGGARGPALGGPALVRSFGPLADGGRAAPPSRNRRISYAGGNTFWTLPPDGAGWGYELQLWRTDGTLLRTLRRDVPWFPTGAQAMQGVGNRPPPELEVVHDDGTGLLFIVAVVANDSYKPLPEIRDFAEQQAAMESMIDIYAEVIDTNAGVVLASNGPMRHTAALAMLPRGLFPRTRQGYQPEETADGLAVMRIVDLQLVGK